MHILGWARGQVNEAARGSFTKMHRSFVGSRSLRVRLRFLRMTRGRVFVGEGVWRGGLQKITYRDLDGE